MTAHTFFLMLGLLFFLIAGLRGLFNVSFNKISWTDMGFAAVVAAYLFPLLR